MNVATQISGNIRPNSNTFASLVSLLAYIGIYVTQSPADESLFYAPEANEAWQQYNEALDFYESIAHSAFHIVSADEPITQETGLHILYAMTKNRPIVTTGALHFSATLSPFIKGIVAKHGALFHSVNPATLDLPDLQRLLGTLQPTDYRLSKTQHILIASMVKTHFRTLLESAKPQQINLSTLA